MPRPSRRRFLGVSGLAGSGFFFAAGTRRAYSQAAIERPTVACIGVGGKGGSDSDNAALFGDVIAICDVDRKTLESKGNAEKFKDAERFTDYRELLAKHGKKIDIVTVSTPDHMHAPATLDAMRLGISCYTQKPLTRTIYEARLLAKVAADTGVCTQMGNQGTALASSREAIAQIRSGVLGPLREVYAWSNRPVWAQGPGRRMNLRSYQAQAMTEVNEAEDAATSAEDVAEIVADLVKKKQQEIGKALERLDWKNWLGVAPSREYWPGLYHAFQHRGWWDFGTGALGDMACHMLTVPFASCGLRDPVSVVARTTGHDFDSFPASSIIKFEFPETSERPSLPFWWYDRKGNKPPAEVFAKWGIDKVADSGVLVVGEKGAFYSSDDYCGKYELKGVEKVQADFEPAEATGKGNDADNMFELFRAKQAGDPQIAKSNFVDRAGPLTETILLGNLAVWAAAQGGPGGAMGEWGEKVDWNARNLEVTNLAALKTPRVAELIKPVYPAGYTLDT
ncbi:MAG: gfo/Idh/MocA family oxidoreductase [Planctomycetia bacterium]|nr:gfo/Idh/MocA family oxidoreductase [Planctomycetia bacterium]